MHRQSERAVHARRRDNDSDIHMKTPRKTGLTTEQTQMARQQKRMTNSITTFAHKQRNATTDRRRRPKCGKYLSRHIHKQTDTDTDSNLNAQTNTKTNPKTTTGQFCRTAPRPLFSNIGCARSAPMPKDTRHGTETTNPHQNAK